MILEARDIATPPQKGFQRSLSFQEVTWELSTWAAGIFTFKEKRRARCMLVPECCSLTYHRLGKPFPSQATEALGFKCQMTGNLILIIPVLFATDVCKSRLHSCDGEMT